MRLRTWPKDLDVAALKIKGAFSQFMGVHYTEIQLYLPVLAICVSSR